MAKARKLLAVKKRKLLAAPKKANPLPSPKKETKRQEKEPKKATKKKGKTEKKPKKAGNRALKDKKIGKRHRKTLGKAKVAKKMKGGKGKGRGKRARREKAKKPGFFEEHGFASGIDLTDLKTVKNILDWLEFLVSKLGVVETKNTLRYYEKIRAIDPAFRKMLEHYLKGLKVSGKTRGRKGKKKKMLSQKEHEQSLEMLNRIFTEAKRF